MSNYQLPETLKQTKQVLAKLYNEPALALTQGYNCIALSTSINSGCLVQLEFIEDFFQSYKGRIISEHAIRNARDLNLNQELEDVAFLKLLVPPDNYRITNLTLPFAENVHTLNECLDLWLTIEKVIPLAKQSGQFEIYRNVYQPCLKYLIEMERLDIKSMIDEHLYLKYQGEINDLCTNLNQIEEVIEVFAEEYYHPLNIDQTTKLLGSLKDPAELLWQENADDVVINAILEVRRLSTLYPLLPPKGFELITEPTNQWEIDKQTLQREAFDKGWITGPCGLRFYTPLCSKSVFGSSSIPVSAIREAKLAFAQARSWEKLLAYRQCCEKGLKLVRLTEDEIIWMRKL